LRQVSIAQKIEGGRSCLHFVNWLPDFTHTIHSGTCCKFIKSLAHKTSTHGIRQSINTFFCLCEYNVLATFSIFMCEWLNYYHQYITPYITGELSSWNDTKIIEISIYLNQFSMTVGFSQFSKEIEHNVIPLASFWSSSPI
jgi:hypothetical protein